MEKDNLKKFIDDNKDEFDFGMPSDKVWNGIEKKVSPKKSNKWLILGVAASVSLILTVGFLTLRGSTGEIAPEEIPVALEEEQEKYLSNEIAEIETFYATQVDLKVEEVRKYEESEDLLIEIDLLKEEFNLLQKEMGDGANQETILEAMIQNYRLRLNLLEDLLKEFEEEKTKENETT